MNQAQDQVVCLVILRALCRKARRDVASEIKPATQAFQEALARCYEKYGQETTAQVLLDVLGNEGDDTPRTLIKTYVRKALSA